MTISSTTAPAGGDRLRFAGTFQSIEYLTQSTATTPQALSLTTDLSVLGAGTASGNIRNNLYTLGTSTTVSTSTALASTTVGAVEGQEKYIFFTATGFASLIFTQATNGRIPFSEIFRGTTTASDSDTSLASATGQYVFQESGDFMHLKFINDAWRILGVSGATIATTT